MSGGDGNKLLHASHITHKVYVLFKGRLWYVKDTVNLEQPHKNKIFF